MIGASCQHLDWPQMVAFPGFLTVVVFLSFPTRHHLKPRGVAPTGTPMYATKDIFFSPSPFMGEGRGEGEVFILWQSDQITITTFTIVVLWILHFVLYPWLEGGRGPRARKT